MATVKCPLYPKKLKAFKSMTLHQLQAIEKHISTSSCSHPPIQDFVFKGRLKGSNPLLLACHHGDLDSVKHIVEDWGADIQAKAVYYTDLLNAKYSWCTSIQGATPLFVAACNGHISIVRYLVEKGANVSAKTHSKTVRKFDGLTPLHGAVMDLWWEDPGDSTCFSMAKETRDAIVIFLLESGADPSTLPSDRTPIWMRTYCGAKAVTTLINHGLNLNQRNRKGQTILHVWSDFFHFRVTEEESLAVIKLILEKGANYLLMDRDNRGLTPILEAVLCENGEETNEKVLNFLLDSDSIDRLEKIDALELAYAVIRVRNQSPQASDYWRRALRLRMNQDPPIHKIPFKLKSGLTKEWTTSEELEHVIQHPSEHDIQSILVQLRILSGRNCKAVCSAIHDICKNGSCWTILGQDRYAELLDILWAMLELMRRDDPAKSEYDETIVLVYNYLISTLLKMKTNSSVLLNAATIKTSLSLILVTDRFNSYECDDIDDDEDDNVDVDSIDDLRLESNTFQILRCVALMADLLPQMVLDKESIDALGQLVHRKRKNSSGRSLLHLACENPKGINLLETVRLLLQLGADPNAGDKEGNSPLHSLVKLNRELIDPTARLLLEKGAHLDRVNKSGKTAVDHWLEKHGSRKRLLDEEDQQGAAVGFKNQLPDWCNEGVPRLLCLSARYIRAHRVPYRVAPVTLHPFIEMH